MCFQLYSLHGTDPSWLLAGACGQACFLRHGGFSETSHPPRTIFCVECFLAFSQGLFKLEITQRADLEYLSYSSIAVIKPHDLGNLEKKVFSWAYSFRELESIVTRQHGSWQQICWL